MDVKSAFLYGTIEEERIFRYLNGQPNLGLWYPKDSPFDLEAFSDSDYAGASLDRKSTTGAEYVAVAHCYGQVLANCFYSTTCRWRKMGKKLQPRCQLKTITEASLKTSQLKNADGRLLLPHERTYVAPTLTQKLFSNMRRVSKGYTGVNIPLFSSMLVQGPIQQGDGSTVPVESHHTPITTPPPHKPPRSSPSREDYSADTEIPFRSREPTELVKSWEIQASHFQGEKSMQMLALYCERVWDQNHAFIPKDFEIEKEVMKRPGFDFPQKSIKKNDDSQQQAGSSKKRSREDF
ncbi:hypothetical protein Tco_0860117 [Tanacetum coccineum]|uniref:Reverse transcriptase Ty1/copia-type domain-containing protein n=1 Tax=Tanacetum coccineum TaxID=301880 RepID=A0ABQ5BDZ5_9ASTR